MTLGELLVAIEAALLSGMTIDTPVTIQLPDDQPPVDFVLEYYDHDMANIFPLPPKGQVWDHHTNVIYHSPEK